MGGLSLFHSSVIRTESTAKLGAMSIDIGLRNNGERYFGQMNLLLNSDVDVVLRCGEGPKNDIIQRIARAQ